MYLLNILYSTAQESGGKGKRKGKKKKGRGTGKEKGGIKGGGGREKKGREREGPVVHSVKRSSVILNVCLQRLRQKSLIVFGVASRGRKMVDDADKLPTSAAPRFDNTFAKMAVGKLSMIEEVKKA
jgi:hypothetical protein